MGKPKNAITCLSCRGIGQTWYWRGRGDKKRKVYTTCKMCKGSGWIVPTR